MSTLKGSKRYWCRDESGNVLLTTVKVGEPEPDAHWMRGFPPRSEEVARAFAQRIHEVHAGVPKSPSQREKMRQRKLGISKSDEHIRRMRVAHAERQPRIREVHKRHPQLTYHQASGLEARLRKDPNAPDWYRELLRKV